MTTSSRIRHALAVAACTAALGLAGVATAASAANAAVTEPAAGGGTIVTLVHASAVIPDTGSSCGTGSSSGNVQTCMRVVGSGLHIDSATASAHVINSGRTLQACIHGPQGTIGCTPFVFVPVGGTLSITWSPNRNEPAGDYCANTWRANSGGASPTEIGHQCVNVHA